MCACHVLHLHCLFAAFLSDTNGQGPAAINAQYQAARNASDPLKLDDKNDVPYKDVPAWIHPGWDGTDAGVDKEPYLLRKSW